MNKKILTSIIFSVIFLSNAFLACPVQAATLASQLSGKILLQVESHGEAWYVNPKDLKRYYLGKPEDAYSLMKQLSTGISEKEFASWNHGAPSWAKGKLYIRPQSHGEAYYVDFNQRWNYLGRPLDAWLLFRAKGLGISNSDLTKIPSASVVNNSSEESIKTSADDYVSSLSWKYKLEKFNLKFPLKTSVNSAYASAVKSFYYRGDVEPQGAREQFYGLFFNKKTGDTAVKDLVAYGREVAAKYSWSQDQIVEFLVALVQYIPYDSAKLNQSPMQPNYPYETLYRNSGICSDKTFLTVAILRELGYGAAILDFPDLNHSAAGISCPLADSVNNSGYCYIETTNYFPIGVTPPVISEGLAVSSDDLGNLFSDDNLSQMQIFQKTSGLIYQGVAVTKKIVADLQTKKAWIDSQAPILEQKSKELDAKQITLISQQNQLANYQNNGDISAYNSLAEVYNTGVLSYNTELETYRNDLTVYNKAVNEYNDGLRSLHQQ